MLWTEIIDESIYGIMECLFELLIEFDLLFRD